MEEEKLRKAAQTLFDAHCGNRAVLVTDFVEASDVILNAMRDEITVHQVLQWCADKGYVELKI